MTKKHDIIWFDSVNSTNDVARCHIHDLDNLSVVSASCQTSGRGQGDRRWLSEPGRNLLFSIVLKSSSGRESLKAHEQFAISATTAESVVELLERHGIGAWIKPPNDIYVGRDKICGILIENSLRGNILEHSIIGVGLNVNQTEFDPTLPNPISMSSITAETYDTHILLEEFMDIFARRLKISLSLKK